MRTAVLLALVMISSACTTAQLDDSVIAKLLLDYQSLLVGLLGLVALPVIMKIAGRTRARQAAVTAKRVEILDALGPNYVQFIVKARFLALDAEEGRLESEIGTQHRAEYDAFMQGFHADNEVLSLKTEQYFENGALYASRMDDVARWCARLDDVVTRLAERGDGGGPAGDSGETAEAGGDNAGAGERAAGAGGGVAAEAEAWGDVKSLTLELRAVYRELLEHMSHEVRDKGRAEAPVWRASFDGPRLDSLRERVIAA